MFSPHYVVVASSDEEYCHTSEKSIQPRVKQQGLTPLHEPIVSESDRRRIQKKKKKKKNFPYFLNRDIARRDLEHCG
jgi:hypothetical protein